MKTSKKIRALLLLSFLAGTTGLASCFGGGDSTSNSSDSGVIQDSSSIDSETTSSEEETQVSSSYSGEPKTFKFYCLNDFHGSIVERDNEVGLKSLFSFLKSKVDEDPEHTIVLSAGDMFQGSWESNSNLGKLIVESMNAVPFTAGALGNHDFDYGIQALNEMQELASFPMLAGNIELYGTGQKWSGSEGSLLIERDGVKIGIIGNIGQGQTTSIQSRIVQDLDFVDPLPVIKAESKALRQQGAQIIVSVLHDGSSAMTRLQIEGAKEHFDGGFLGHTHQNESKKIDGVPLVQSGSNGRSYSYFELTISPDGVEPSNAGYRTAPSSFQVDPIFEEIERKYLDDAFYAKTNEVLATLTGTSLDRYGVARLGCKAMYEEYVGRYPDLAVTIENSQRATLYTGEITYGQLYKATPFMNSFVVAKMKGSEIRRQAQNSSCYTGDVARFGTLKDNEYYTVGIIDYIYFHQDRNKTYDYVPSAANPNNLIAVHEDYPVDITARYLKNTLKGKVNGWDMEGEANGFNLY